MGKRRLSPEDLFDSRPYGFVQVVESGPGRHVRLSGQVAWDAREAIDGAGDLGRQTARALANVTTGLEAAGASLADVVALRIYVVDLPSHDSGIISTHLKATFPDALPAATWIGVAALASPDFLIEIEAEAIVEDEGAG